MYHLHIDMNGKYFQTLLLVYGFLMGNAQIYQTNMIFSEFGLEFQEVIQSDLLRVVPGVQRVLICVLKCNQDPKCRFIDYDSSNKICRHFFRGTIVPSISLYSRVGIVSVKPQLYSAHGQQCSQHTCTINRYLICDSSSVCKCPLSFIWNGTMCSAKDHLYRWNASGIQVAGFGSGGNSQPNSLNRPIQVVVDSNDTLYISDSQNHRIQQWLSYSTSGTTIAGKANGNSGNSLSELFNPEAVVLDSSNGIYIAEAKNHRVVRWMRGASSGTLIAGTGTNGSNTHQLSNPRGLAIHTQSGGLLVADSDNHRIMLYVPGSLNGTVVAGGNGPGMNRNQLFYPRGIFYDSSTMSVLIANNKANNIVRWTLGNNNWTLVAGSPSGVPGNSSLLLNYPTGVVLDSLGNVYVSDEGNHRIQFFLNGETNGTTIAGVTGVVGANSQLFNKPASVAIDRYLNLYVADYLNDRIQKFVFNGQ